MYIHALQVFTHLQICIKHGRPTDHHPITVNITVQNTLGPPACRHRKILDRTLNYRAQPRTADSVGLRHLRIHNAHKFPGDTGAQGPHFENTGCKNEFNTE